MGFLRNEFLCLHIHYRRAFGTAVVSLTNSRCIVFCNSRSAVIVKEVVVVVVNMQAQKLISQEPH